MKRKNYLGRALFALGVYILTGCAGPYSESKNMKASPDELGGIGPGAKLKPPSVVPAKITDVPSMEGLEMEWPLDTHMFGKVMEIGWEAWRGACDAEIDAMFAPDTSRYKGTGSR